MIGIVILLGSCSPKTTPARKNPKTVETEKVVKEEPQKELEKPKPVAKEPQEMIISLILPFELTSINYKTASLQDMRKAEIAIDFYQGFKMALDSVAHQKGAINFKLQVFDSKDDPAQLGVLAAKGGIKASDLIVGPVFPSGIKTFSSYSKNMKMPMISPLAASDPDSFNNPFLISVNNSLEQHTYKAASFIKNYLRPKKVIMIRSGQADEYKYAVPFKEGMDSLAKGIPFAEIGIKAVGYDNVYKSLNPIGLNVVVLPATDRVFLIEMMKTLEKLSTNFQIAVIGHPGWEKAAFLDMNQLERLNTYITSAYQIDYKTSRVANFVRYYRSNFSLEPSEYAFKGFDIGYYIGMLMNDKGKDFMEEILKQPFDGIHNNFNFKKDPKFGYYNTSLMMMRYQFGTLRKVD